MRLEYKIGVVVALAVVGLGTWFFVTRDRAADTEVAQAPQPSRSDAPRPAAGARQASPRPAPTFNRPTPSPGTASPGAAGRVEQSRVSAPVTTRPSQAAPTFSLNPDRSTSPGIRSETPVPKPEAAPEPPASVVAPVAPPGQSGNVSVTTAAPVRSAPPVPGRSADAPGSSLAAPPVAPPAKMHVMEQGDTIYGLAIKYYGAAKYAPLIVEANKQLGDPKRIPVGAKITIPPAPASATDAAKIAAPAAARAVEPRRQPPNTRPYEVKKGDTWRGLAAQYYGSESEWPQLFELNRRSPGDTARILRVGETVYVPVAAPPAKTLMGTTGKP